MQWTDFINYLLTFSISKFIFAIVRIKKIHKLLLLIFLSSILTGQVGVHFFHNHSYNVIADKKAKETDSDYSLSNYEGKHCNICDLQVFNTVFGVTEVLTLHIEGIFSEIILLTSQKNLCPDFSLNGRAPPVFYLL